MQWKTLAGFSVLGMALSSASVTWLTTPTATAAASPVSPESAKAPSLQSHLVLSGDIELDARVGHARLDARTDAETYLLFQARARDSRARPPVAVALLIDHSGSMKGRRLENALSAARGLVARLREGDHLSVIGYDRVARVLVPTTQIDASSRERVGRTLGNIVATGSTCVSCALDAGTEALSSSALANAVKQIVLLTDGEATTGVKSLEGFQSLARRAREAGIGVSSIGIDLDYNEALLGTLARISNGRHHFVRNPGDLEQAFDRELGELSGSVANDARISLELPSEVELLNVFDRDVELNGNRLTVRLGSFTGRDTKTLLLSVRLRAGAPRQVALAKFGFEYALAGDGGRAIRNGGTLGVDVDSVPQSDLDSEVEARIGQGRTGSLLFEAGKLFSSGEPADFQKLDERFADEIARVERQKGRAKPAAGTRALDAEKQALTSTRDRLRISRSVSCGCAPGDLACAMSCRAGGAKRPVAKSCSPNDPLCADLGDISGDEKAAAKESVGASSPFLK